MWATKQAWGDDQEDSDGYYYEAPRVNIVVRRAPSLASTDYDERERGPPPSLPDDARSVTTSSTTGTNIQDSKSNVSRGTAAGRHPPGNTRSSANVSSVTSSVSGDAPVGAQSPVPGQRKSAWGTRSTAASRPSAPSMRDTQDDDVVSTQSRPPPPGQRQPGAKPRSPSASTVSSSAGSNRPTGHYAPSVSQSSHTSGQRAAERDSRSSTGTTLHNTASSAGGPRRPSSVARTSSSMSGRTAVSSESVPPEGGFPTFDDTAWGDTISAAQSRPKKASDAGRNDDADEEKTSQSEQNTTGTEKTSEGDQNTTGSGKKFRGWTKGRGGRKKFAAKIRGAPPPQSDALEVAMGIDLQPAGPGSTWGNGAEAW
jgi:hypothetical protein